MRASATCLGVVLLATTLSWGESGGAAPEKRVALTYDDSRLTEFHKQVLTVMKLPYAEELVDGRTAIWWTPRSEAESFEVQYRVSQYAFAVANCPLSRWPTPETPAGTIKSCPGK